MPFHERELPKRYGPLVRIAPNELAFSSPQAWRDIYGQKKAELPKSPDFYRSSIMFPMSVFDATQEPHTVLRRQLVQGFGELPIDRSRLSGRIFNSSSSVYGPLRKRIAITVCGIGVTGRSLVPSKT
ncbi:hypothetical protein GGR50DRAFT_6066 [Xylaria sp. CBS 124048]|nr:hypothetical protein GGR50DRAFT_6066 [Xylaria sp. CBS 124048]